MNEKSRAWEPLNRQSSQVGTIECPGPFPLSERVSSIWRGWTLQSSLSFRATSDICLCSSFCTILCLEKRPETKSGLGAGLSSSSCSLLATLSCSSEQVVESLWTPYSLHKDVNPVFSQEPWPLKLGDSAKNQTEHRLQIHPCQIQQEKVLYVAQIYSLAFNRMMGCFPKIVGGKHYASKTRKIWSLLESHNSDIGMLSPELWEFWGQIWAFISVKYVTTSGHICTFEMIVDKYFVIPMTL